MRRVSASGIVYYPCTKEQKAATYQRRKAKQRVEQRAWVARKRLDPDYVLNRRRYNNGYMARYRKNNSRAFRVNRLLSSVTARVPGSVRSEVRPAVEAALDKAVGNPCQYCGTTITLANISIDHAIPICRGGNNNADNLVGICRECNPIKGIFTEEEFFLLLDACKGRDEMRRILRRTLKVSTVIFRRGRRYGR